MSKHPWALGIHGPKKGVGTYTEKPLVHITHIHANHRVRNLSLGAPCQNADQVCGNPTVYPSVMETDSLDVLTFPCCYSREVYLDKQLGVEGLFP